MTSTRHHGLLAITVIVLLSLPWLATPAGTAPAGPGGVQGNTYRMERAYFVSAHVPTADVDRVLAAVATAVGLEYGHYDQVAYIDSEGLEQFRPTSGSKAGERPDAVRMPTKIVSFSVQHDDIVLKRALDAIYASHSYEEPVIYVGEIWRSRATSSDDKNPNRWWNRKADPKPNQ